MITTCSPAAAIVPVQTGSPAGFTSSAVSAGSAGSPAGCGRLESVRGLTPAASPSGVAAVGLGEACCARALLITAGGRKGSRGGTAPTTTFSAVLLSSFTSGSAGNTPATLVSGAWCKGSGEGVWSFFKKSTTTKITATASTASKRGLGALFSFFSSGILSPPGSNDQIQF